MILSERTKKRKIENELNIVNQITSIQSQSYDTTYSVNHQHILENSSTHINSFSETPIVNHTEYRSIISHLIQNIPHEPFESNINHENYKNYFTNQLSETTFETESIKNLLLTGKLNLIYLIML